MRPCAGSLLLGLLSSALLLGCQTTPTPRPPPPELASLPTSAQSYSGRISMQSEALPGQRTGSSWMAQFTLHGSPAAGQLELLAPTGSILAQLRWSPDWAQWQSQGQTRYYSSVEALMQAALDGNSLPPDLLFAWLAGEAASTPDWRIDLSQYEQRLIRAERLQPLPRTQVRIKLDPAP